jgi:tRNA-specific 2-thiouridylase
VIDELTIAGVSGGVDSSVAALCLARAGRRVAGMFMKNWEEDDADGTCPAEADAADAESVCSLLGIDFHTRNFASEYWDEVFEQFLAEHRAGRTPNPDVLCNREIKFRTFLDHARDLGATRIATGHYARVSGDASGWRLLRARDTNKDQTYFLHTLGQSQLAVTDFPVGELPKAEVRRLAAEAGFATAEKKDSTGICFIGERDFRGFLARYLPPVGGDIRSARGERLGEHPGVHFFTIGQRQGLGVGGRRDGSGEAWFVVGKDPATRTLIVDQGDSALLYSTRLQAAAISWVAGQPPAPRFACTAKTRYRQPDQRCDVEQLDDDCWQVRFETAQRAVTPGQSVVFYDGDICLGGGIIDATDAAYGGLEKAA